MSDSYEKPGMRGSRLKILLADEDNKWLKEAGDFITANYPEYQLQKSSSYEQGIKLCRSEDYDVVFFSATLAETDPGKLCRELKSDPVSADTPLVIVTPEGSDSRKRVNILRSGADAVLEKPFDEAGIRSVLGILRHPGKSGSLSMKEKENLEKTVRERTEALETELADRKKAERKLIQSLDKQNRNRLAILNLLEDLKTEMGEKKQVEEKLKAERNLLRTLIDSMPDTIYILDREGRKIIANKADVNYLGFDSESDVIGKTDMDLFPGETGRIFHQNNLSVIESGKPLLEIEETFTDKNGATRWLMSSQYPLFDTNGQITGLLGTGHDVTDRKAKDAAITKKNWELEFLNRLATDCASLQPHDDMSGFLTRQLKEISNSGFIIFSEYEASEKILYTRHVEADSKILNHLIKITGDRIVNAPSPIIMTDENYTEIISEIVSHKKSLTEISFGAIPKLIDKAFSSLTGFNTYMGLSFVVAGELYGTCLLGFRQNDQLPPDELLKSFAHIAAVSIRRRRAEEELAASEERYRVLIENQGEGVTIVDLKENFVFANLAAEEMFGVAKGTLIGRNIREFVSEEEFGKVRSETGRRSKTEKSTYELNIHTPGAEQRTLLVTATPRITEGGIISGTFGVFRDITERKILEEKITESEAYYRTLIDLSPDGIITADMEGTIKFCSNKIYQIFGFPYGTQVVGNSLLDFVHPDSHDALMERISDILSGNVTPITIELKLLKADGSVFWGELSSSPLPYPNADSFSLMVVCRDISGRKAAEEELIRSRDKAEESDRLKTAFLHNISHEIRTPMNAINGFSSMLSDPDFDLDTQRSFIDIIINSSNQLLSVVSDIIEISNVEAGLLKFSRREIRLNSFLDSIVADFQSKAKEKGLSFEYKWGLSDKYATIYTDSEKLIQVLFNLLNNAFKFTSAGRVELSYELRNGSIEFSITDTGIGIPADQHEKIFDRFYQVDNALVRQYEGTGLGLSISRAYVEVMGGKIWVESIPGSGSVFHFTIPYTATGEKETQVAVLKEPIKPVRKEKKRILVAEDEEINYLLISRLLSSLDAEIIHAKNGREAVTLCESDKDIDLVLMDVKMPLMDGHQATVEIRKTLPDLPVIALTAYAFSVDREKALSSGCNDYLSKPVKREVLLQTVRNYLNITS